MLSLTKKCASLTSTSFLFPKRRPTLYQDDVNSNNDDDVNNNDDDVNNNNDDDVNNNDDDDVNNNDDDDNDNDVSSSNCFCRLKSSGAASQPD